jgi:hypothetical protein
MIAEEEIDLGPCCACDTTDPAAGIYNIMLLDRLCPMPGRGWGCVQCGLPANYASAVLCNACLEAKAEIRFVCTGYPAKDGRTPIEDAPQAQVKHNPLYHPEMLVAMTWFDDSPDYGWPECVCSVCKYPIPDPDEIDEVEAEKRSGPQGPFIPLRLYRVPSKKHPHGQEARFCPDCVPAVLKFMKLK